MTSREGLDSEIVKKGRDFSNVFATHIEMCKLLEDVEAEVITDRDADEVRKSLTLSCSHWHTIMLRLGEQPAYTNAGILAKCQVIQKYFSEYLAQDAVFEKLINSLVVDIERKVGLEHILD